MHKGNGDLNTHLQSEKHHKAVREAVASMKMTNYVVTAGSKCEDEITGIEGTLAFHAVLKSFEENNIAYFGVAPGGSNHNELGLFPTVTAVSNLSSIITVYLFSCAIVFS